MENISAKINTQLKLVYQDWKMNFDRSNIDVNDFSPPLLVNVPNEYASSQKRIMVFGQETFGWSWTQDLREQFPNYSIDYKFSELRSLADFLSNSDAVEALCWGYEQFAFSKHQPINFRSPFWRAFRELGEDAKAGLVWSNVVKSDFQGGTILQLPDADRRGFLEQQNIAVRSEIDILKPDAIVFFTGPNYDTFLHMLFPGLVIRPVEGEKMLSQLEHPSLPKMCFRTYHPGFLVRSGLWGQIKLIRQEILRIPG